MKWHLSFLLGVVSLILILAGVFPIEAREPRGSIPSLDPSIINRRIRDIQVRDHTTIPMPTVIEPGFSQTPRLQIINNTEAYLMVYFSGPSFRQVTVRPWATERVVLTAGNYQVAAEVNDPGVLPFAGFHRYDREEYEIRFSIRSIRW